MIRQHVRVALLAGGIMAATALTARAQDAPQPATGAPAPAPAPQLCTVYVNEWVPENYQTTRTVYKRESREEAYTAYRCETVPETRTRQVTVYKSVPDVQTRTRKVCKMVPHVEERTIMQSHWTCKPECQVVRNCVDRGHWECREVPCGPSLCDRIRKCFHHNDCCDPCEPVRTKTVRCWVPNPVWEEQTVTVMKRVCESRPVTIKVNVCKAEWSEEQYQCTVYKCVPETRTETYTCNVQRTVPYQATRTVCVCVPTQETVTCTRMVCRQVAKQVPCEPCPPADCCDHPCGGRRHGLHGLFSGLSFRHHRGGCGSCCD